MAEHRLENLHKLGDQVWVIHTRRTLEPCPKCGRRKQYEFVKGTSTPMPHKTFLATTESGQQIRVSCYCEYKWKGSHRDELIPIRCKIVGIRIDIGQTCSFTLAEDTGSVVYYVVPDMDDKRFTARRQTQFRNYYSYNKTVGWTYDEDNPENERSYPVCKTHTECLEQIAKAMVHPLVTQKGDK